MFWNFTERQEKDILADLTFASHTPPPSREGSLSRSSSVSRTNAPPESARLLSDLSDEESRTHVPTSHYGAVDTGDGPTKTTRSTTTGLMVRPLKEMDVQIEDFHFEYNPRTRSPRIRDDMITYSPVRQG